MSGALSGNRCFSLLIDLLLSGGYKLGDADDRYQDKEYDGLGLSRALGVGGVGVDDVQRQHLRCLDNIAVSQCSERRATGKGKVLVIELKAVG